MKNIVANLYLQHRDLWREWTKLSTQENENYAYFKCLVDSKNFKYHYLFSMQFHEFTYAFKYMTLAFYPLFF